MVSEVGGRAGKTGVMEARRGYVFCDKCSWQVKMSTEKPLLAW